MAKASLIKFSNKKPILKNITLYLGAIHCENLAQDLGKIGYKVIFEAGVFDEKDLREDVIPNTCSKADFQKFFSIT